MQNSIKDYFDGILTALSALPLAGQPKIELDNREEVWFIRADVYFLDNSLLHFRELWIKQDEQRFKKTYSYHFQRADGTMIFRYDNAPHFLHLASAPHHKHVGGHDVVAANAPDLESVLKEIEGMVKP